MDPQWTPEELEARSLQAHIRKIGGEVAESLERQLVVCWVNKLLPELYPSDRLKTEAQSVIATAAETESSEKYVLACQNIFKNIWSDLSDCLTLFGNEHRELVTTLFRATLFTRVEPMLLKAMRLCYTAGLNCFVVARKSDVAPLPKRLRLDPPENPDECPARCNAEDAELCTCDRVTTGIMDINKYLVDLGLMDHIGIEVIQGVIKEALLEEVAAWEHLGSDSEVRGSGTLKLNNLMDAQLFQFLSKCHSGFGHTADMETKDTRRRVAVHRRYLDCLIKEIFATWVLDHLYDLITRYPSGSECLDDFKACFDCVPQLRARLTARCKDVFEKEILNLATSTSDILVFYLQSVQLLRTVDSTGVILQMVSEPLQEFLRKRDDTVRCILSLITQPPPSLKKSIELHGPSLDALTGGEEVVTAHNWMKWEPDPIDALNLKGDRYHKSADLVALLVGIYGSKEVFVQEYSSLLAERLLKNSSLLAHKDEKDLENIKKRFGDADLNKCVVMINDVKSSRRILNGFDLKLEESRIQLRDNLSISALVASAQFWPAVKETKLKLPDRIGTAMETYTKHFEDFRPNRSVDWHPHLETWRLPELANKLGLAASVTRRHLYYWVSAGILRECGSETFTINDSLPSTAGEPQMDADVDMDESTEDGGGDAIAKLEVYWAYISGLLRNMTSLTPDRIFTMLSLVSEDPVTLDDVKQFLSEKLRLGLLLMQNGHYSLPKK